MKLPATISLSSLLNSKGNTGIGNAIGAAVATNVNSNANANATPQTSLQLNKDLFNVKETIGALMVDRKWAQNALGQLKGKYVRMTRASETSHIYLSMCLLLFEY